MTSHQTGMRDPHYDLVSVLYHTMQGAETVGKYLEDVSGDQELNDFMRQVQDQYRQMGDRAKQLLATRLQGATQRA